MQFFLGRMNIKLDEWMELIRLEDENQNEDSL